MASLPPVDPYPMPAAHQLPASTAGWRPDPGRALLLVHDMQSYFLRPLLAARTPADALIPNVARLRQRCADLGIPVAFTAQPGGMTETERGLLKDMWGPGMRVQEEDRQLVPPLTAGPDDWMLTKWRYSAFFRTGLLERMRERGLDQLLLCGVYAHVGVLMTAVDAFSHDIQPFLVADAVADFTRAYHDLALDYAAKRCAVVTATEPLMAALGAARVAT
ncbi:isochorismatase family protein [Streptomyces boninensis]|uniref:isochorismatase family protein n=1 Tax=Streptomyces boninensis TaxID=2039455 RepID=UPI003B21D420